MAGAMMAGENVVGILMMTRMVLKSQFEKLMSSFHRHCLHSFFYIVSSPGRH